MDRYLVLCVVFSSLFLILGVHSGNGQQIQATYDDPSAQSVSYNTRKSFDLQCNVTEDIKDLKWQKDGTLVSEIKELKGRAETSKKGSMYILHVRASQDTDQGNYTCVGYDSDMKTAGSQNIAVKAKIAIKTPTNVNVVEKESLKIVCSVVGYPKLRWFLKNDTYNHTYTESEDRIVLSPDPDKNIENAILEIKSVEMFDRGHYTCIADIDNGVELNSTCMVRIKDQYAALWPFIGICAEVFILCAIIFIYEKKRNKSDMEESDTDQSPDQKNTPDHGKDTNLRHRQ